MAYVLVAYYSRNGSVEKLAQLITRGVESVNGIEAMLRTVPAVSPDTNQTAPEVPESGANYVSYEELENCSGLIIGSPTRFGNMAAPMKYFLDGTSKLWMSGALDGKPAGLFTSTASMHGGQESTLLSMMIPLMHHGMIITGLPFTIPELTTTKSGGTPYGATHVAGPSGDQEFTHDEKILATSLGKRVAEVALKLNKN